VAGEYAGECSVNRAMALLLMRRLLGAEGRPEHCEGAAECVKRTLRRLRKMRLLVIDREYNRALRNYLEGLISRASCKPCTQSTSHVLVYKCSEAGSLKVIAFNGPPEGILANLDPSMRRHLSDPKWIRRFKREAYEKLSSGGCSPSDSVCRALEVLYKAVERSLRACGVQG